MMMRSFSDLTIHRVILINFCLRFNDLFDELVNHILCRTVLQIKECIARAIFLLQLVLHICLNNDCFLVHYFIVRIVDDKTY